MVALNLSSIINPLSQNVAHPDSQLLHLATDSRRVADTQGVLFFAIRTRRNDGARFVEPLYRRGVRNFVVDNNTSDNLHQQIDSLAEANVWYVADVVAAL